MKTKNLILAGIIVSIYSTQTFAFGFNDKMNMNEYSNKTDNNMNEYSNKTDDKMNDIKEKFNENKERIKEEMKQRYNYIKENKEKMKEEMKQRYNYIKENKERMKENFNRSKTDKIINDSYGKGYEKVSELFNKKIERLKKEYKDAKSFYKKKKIKKEIEKIKAMKVKFKDYLEKERTRLERQMKQIEKERTELIKNNKINELNKIENKINKINKKLKVKFNKNYNKVKSMLNTSPYGRSVYVDPSMKDNSFSTGINKQNQIQTFKSKVDFLKIKEEVKKQIEQSTEKAKDFVNNKMKEKVKGLINKKYKSKIDSYNDKQIENKLNKISIIENKFINYNINKQKKETILSVLEGLKEILINKLKERQTDINTNNILNDILK